MARSGVIIVGIMKIKIENGQLTPSQRLILDRYVSQFKNTTLELIPAKEVAKRRTLAQNRALHMWFGMVADTLNGAGLTIQETLDKSVDIEWTPENVKELLWRRMQKLVLHKKSTTQLRKQEDIDLIYDHLVRWFGNKHHVELPLLPSAEQLEQMDDTFVSNTGLTKRSPLN